MDRDVKCRMVIGLLLLAVGLGACGREETPVPVHELTEQEQQKQWVEDALDPFFMLLDPSSITDPVDFVTRNSQVSVGLGGNLIYRLQKDGENLIRASFSLEQDRLGVEARLYGGLRIAGTLIRPDLENLDLENLDLENLDLENLDLENLDSIMELNVYADGKKTARLGLEYMDSLPLFVLRYPDGTSYALSSFLITGALLDYLLENVLTTE